MFEDCKPTISLLVLSNNLGAVTMKEYWGNISIVLQEPRALQSLHEQYLLKAANQLRLEWMQWTWGVV